MDIIEIIRKNHPLFVRPMRVGDLEKNKCSPKFLTHDFPDDFVVNVKCHQSGELDLRGKREEYRIIVADNLKP